MKSIIVAFVVVLVLAFSFSTSNAWLIYHKPEYRGGVIDAETKAPIEGAVVVVVYYQERIIGNVGGAVTRILDAKEILTDNKGEFYFPSYTVFTPFWSEHFTGFLIYKPGWQGFAQSALDGPMTEKFFSTDVIGKEGEIRSGQDHWKGALGVMELERAKTREERLRAKPAPPDDFTSKELPLFIKIINEERNNLGLNGGYK